MSDVLKSVDDRMSFQNHVVDVWETDRDAASNRLSQMEKALDEKRGNGSIQPIADLDLGEGVVYHSVVYDVGKTGHPDYQPGYGYATVPRVAETGQSAKKMIDSAISILKNPPQASAKT